MNFFTWLTTKRKTLSTMSVAELRAEEMLLENERNQLASKVRRLAGDKQKIIEQGAAEKTPEMRRTLAQQYDLLHMEQSMVARQLNIRSKEAITVGRLRMLRENATSARLGAAGGLRIRDRDLATIEKLIESDQVSMELYQERLDEILRLGQGADESSAAVSPAAQELLRVWGDMDAGLIKDSAAAFDETERRLRERATE